MKRKQGERIPTPSDRQRMQVERMAGYGLTTAQIAAVMEVSPPTLAKYYAEELEKGIAAGTLRVSQTLYELATDPDKPNVTAMIFWLKAKAGWRDRDASVYVNKEDQKTARAKAAAESGVFSICRPDLKAVK